LENSIMALRSRRQFVKEAALAAAALYAGPTRAPAATGLNFEAPEQSAPGAAAVRKLASDIAGHVITPGAPDYEASRLVFNRAFDRRPGLIVRCAGASDVARSLDFARKHNLPLAVRGGGHNRAGLSVCDGGVVIDLAGMNRVEVDAGKRIARAEAGALVRDLDRATQRFGLATTLGGCPAVGVAGLTLGGGQGFLMAKYGVASDNLVSAQLVTADGRQVEASQNRNQDLFWAIRGGGGNFGVATALEFQLHPVSEVLAGALTYPPGRIPELLEAFVKLSERAPDEMYFGGAVLPSKQGPGFRMIVCHSGQPRLGNDLLGPLRALKPKEDTVRVTSYLDVQLNVNPAASVPHFQTDLVLPKLDAAAIATITAAANDAPPDTRVFIFPFFGAVTRIKVGDTAYPLRQPGYELDIMGSWNTPTDKANAVQWVKNLRDKLKPFSRGVYVNQLGETSDELVKAGYGSNYARLVEIKKKYDPENVLRSNQNIKPG
jgi:FAD/FMN-containing dehydrogenase